jgi:hypothetical protein
MVDATSLTWVQTGRGAFIWDEARLPVADIEAFVEGEGQRLNTSFTSIKRCVAGGIEV